MAAAQSIGEKLYASQPGAAGPGPQGGPTAEAAAGARASAKADDVVDAEFKEVRRDA
jgi:molecular chaperone DnaK